MTKVPNLFAIMERKGISSAKLCKDTGLSTGLVSSWKTGAKTPGSKSLKLLSDYLGVSTDEILGNKKSAPSEESALDNEIMQLFAALPADKQAEAINYLKYLASKDKP